ncbi:beta-1,3-galactosyltransferase 1-like [Sitodiplosis mosellana]|uniref:beta-1,3-galactosyltransferase 1-like n=1 Tax=Sitodiplosis mosellana TaxID=263140 RepID=UPI0024438279|nr:beta-1,3-galactosyltransferase 1-like [Sitodiplosis mosellana]
MKEKSLARFLLITAVLLGILIVWMQLSKYSSLKIPKKIYIMKDVKEDSSHVFNVPEFKFLISKPKCDQDGASPHFVTLVHTSPTRFERRIASRDTWAHSDPRIKTYYLMGMVNSPILQKRIEEEEAEFNDIIQGNFVDSYRNMTYKHIMALKWFSENCPHVKYLLKLDDDVFPNIPAIDHYLANDKYSMNYIHGVKAGRKVYRRGKWKIAPEEFNGDLYPEFVEGSAVIYPNTFVLEAFEKTFITPYFWIDDVYVSGILRMQLSFEIKSISQFKLNTAILDMIANGTVTTLPYPMFLITQHNRQYDDVLKLWDMTESYRHAHRPREMSYIERLKDVLV